MNSSPCVITILTDHNIRAITSYKILDKNAAIPSAREQRDVREDTQLLSRFADVAPCDALKYHKTLSKLLMRRVRIAVDFVKSAIAEVTRRLICDSMFLKRAKLSESVIAARFNSPRF